MTGRKRGILKSDEQIAKSEIMKLENSRIFRFHDFGFGNLLRPISKSPSFSPVPIFLPYLTEQG